MPRRTRSAKRSASVWETTHGNGLRCFGTLMGEGDVSIVPLPLGLQGELGVIVAAAERADFPGQTEHFF